MSVCLPSSVPHTLSLCLILFLSPSLCHSLSAAADLKEDTPDRGDGRAAFHGNLIGKGSRLAGVKGATGSPLMDPSGPGHSGNSSPHPSLPTRREEGWNSCSISVPQQDEMRHGGFNPDQCQQVKGSRPPPISDLDGKLGPYCKMQSYRPLKGAPGHSCRKVHP